MTKENDDFKFGEDIGFLMADADGKWRSTKKMEKEDGLAKRSQAERQAVQATQAIQSSSQDSHANGYNQKPALPKEQHITPDSQMSMKEEIARRVHAEIDALTGDSGTSTITVVDNSDKSNDLESRTADAERAMGLHDLGPVREITSLSNAIPHSSSSRDYAEKRQSIGEKIYSLFKDSYGNWTKFSKVFAVGLGITVGGLIFGAIKPDSSKSVINKPGIEIVLVPGHGGHDTGARSADGRYLEKDANLYLTLQTYHELRKLIPGLSIHVPRTSDQDLDFKNYTSWINQLSKGKEDRMIVIHLHQNCGDSSRMFFMYSNDGSLDSYIKTAEFVRYLSKGIKDNAGIDVEKDIGGVHSEDGLYSDEYVRGDGYSVYFLKHGDPYRNIVIELNGINQKLDHAELDRVAKGIASAIKNYIVDKNNGNPSQNPIE